MPSFEINFLDEYTDQALLDELRRIADLMPKGEMLTQRAFMRYRPRVSHSTVQKRFGGWKEALEKAGLGSLYSGRPVSPKMRSQVAKRLSKTGLIAELQRVHALLDQNWLTSNDFNKHSVTSEEAVRKHFGTFRSGLEAAGIPFKPAKLPLFTPEQCFENLAEVWTHYGRRPNYKEMFQPPSKIRAKIYVRRWGTWRNALKAFVAWTNQPEQEPRSATSRDERASSPTAITKPIALEADCRDVRPALRFKVFMRDRFRCVYCGRSPATELGVTLHADHILAVANGGKTTLENLQTLCEICNLGKGTTRVD